MLFWAHIRRRRDDNSNVKYLFILQKEYLAYKLLWIKLVSCFFLANLFLFNHITYKITSRLDLISKYTLGSHAIYTTQMTNSRQKSPNFIGNPKGSLLSHDATTRRLSPSKTAPRFAPHPANIAQYFHMGGQYGIWNWKGRYGVWRERKGGVAGRMTRHSEYSSGRANRGLSGFVVE